MPSKSHTEFEYRFQVNGETIWEKIKILLGFLDGRKRAAALEHVAEKKRLARIAKLAWMKAGNGLEHEILELEAEILEVESFAREEAILWKLNLEEIAMLENLLAEAYAIAEPTRIPGFSDEQMFEANAANEFTAVIGRDIQAEIIANGRPSPAKLRNAMSNPHTFAALKAVGLIPQEACLLLPNADPLLIELRAQTDEIPRLKLA